MQANSRILIVDGDPDVAEVVAFKLTQSGLAVETCANGNLGLQRAKEATPDLLVIDSMVRTMSSLELCRSIREDPILNFIPILLIVALGEKETRERAFALGVDAFFTKPFDPAELVSTIKSMIPSVSQ